MNDIKETKVTEADLEYLMKVADPKVVAKLWLYCPANLSSEVLAKYTNANILTEIVKVQIDNLPEDVVVLNN